MPEEYTRNICNIVYYRVLFCIVGVFVLRVMCDKTRELIHVAISSFFLVKCRCVGAVWVLCAERGRWHEGK